MAKLNVLIQVNISQEASKSGVAPEEVAGLVKQIIALPNLNLRGLMAIPEIEDDFGKQLNVFTKMQKLLHSLQADYPFMDTLSMGMSSDMQAAIVAGSTMVRIGTAIFGARQYL
ncbi:YggS family pyridoxal phosphate-dependent enzyme, partial [Gilliamella sp. Fer4-1]|uniref:YggS family pyridoxal phosphate-dependent enzyme n=2 Tax=unclassified Gilliamella TaxID=2685620 RepID=UPI00080E9FC2